MQMELETETEMKTEMETLAIEATRQGMRHEFVVFCPRDFFGLFSFSLLSENLHLGVSQQRRRRRRLRLLTTNQTEIEIHLIHCAPDEGQRVMRLPTTLR